MTSASTTNAANKSKIVVGVDDAQEGLDLLRLAVEAAGYTFFGAKSGSECLELLYRVVPQLILLDIEMPDPNGFETCRRIRGLPGFDQVPIAFLTARKTTQDVKSGVAAGGDDFIVKPYDILKLVDRVKHWTGRRVTRVKLGS